MGKNPVQHWEIMGADGGALSMFYGKVFDWAPQANSATQPDTCSACRSW